MGGLFSAPRPSPAITAPTPPDSEAVEREARVKTLLRRRRGRADTIATSARGVLAPEAAALQRNRLLGE